MIGVDIELAGAVARRHPTRRPRDWQPGSHYPGSNWTRRCCSWRRWAPSPSIRASTSTGPR